MNNLKLLILLFGFTVISCSPKSNTSSTTDFASQASEEAKTKAVTSTSKEVCARSDENSNTTVSCQTGQKITKVAFASYGMPTGSCGSYKVSGTCNASASMSIANAACIGKASCTIAASNSVFGDPCPTMDKVLVLDVTCATVGATPTPTPIPTVAPTVSPTVVPSVGDVCAKANEGSSAKVVCPSGQTISNVAFASYGVGSGSCGAYKVGSCNASSSLSIAKAACLGKASCTVDANNNVFGDPCVGTNKSLMLDVTCTVSSATPTPSPTVKPTVAPTVAPTIAPTVSPTPSASPVAGAVILPIEVFGLAAANTKEVQFTAAAGASATTLRMTANNLSYDNKMSVQLNNGAWVGVANANSTVEGAGKIYGGIGGGQNTITLSVAIAGGVNGANILRFRFNGTDGISSGFRVISFNLRNSASADLIASSSFVNEDPKAWVAPLNTAADIAAGETLWRTATLKSSALAGAGNLNAKCMDCHSQDGRDLQHFNYSNDAIMWRSMYHGLTQQQGNQIASYIRNLKSKYGVPGDKCRPWNPPYQPGPGLDAGPVADWSCGAGLEAVLPNDTDSLNYLFPSGINKSAIATGGRINVREIPIAFQLPDWKHWLPRVHPKDAYGATFVNSNLNKMYNDEGTGSYNQGSLRANLAKYGANYVLRKVGDFDNNLYYWGVEWGERFTAKGNVNVIADQQKIYGAAQWLLVKNWELAQDFGLETICPQNWAQKAVMQSKVEPRSWCGYWRFVFDASPHILGFPVDNNMFGSKVHDLYIANQWYQLAIILNPGSGAHNVHLPTDWQYAYGLIGDLASASGRQEPVRNLIYVTKGTQEVDNGVGVGDVNRGWTFRMADPTTVWASGANGIWKGVPAATKNAAFNAYLETWLDRSETFPATTWQRIDGDGGDNWCGWSEYRLCWTDYVPGTLRGTSPTVENFATWSYNSIPQMRTDGIDANLLNRYARLMNTLYPSGGFLKLVK